MTSLPLRLSLLLVAVLFVADPSIAAADSAMEARRSMLDRPGSLVIAGGSGLGDEIFGAFRELAGFGPASVVVIPTASDRADREDYDQTLVRQWRARGFEWVTVLHTRNREVADTEAFASAIARADAVWFGGGQQSRLAQSYLGTKVEAELHKLLERGGVIGGSSAGAAIQSSVMITGGNPEARVGEGIDLLRGCVVDQHFSERNRQPRLRGVIEARPGLLGIGIDERTALVVRVRDGRVVGEVVGRAGVHLMMADGSGELWEESFAPGDRLDVVSGERIEAAATAADQ
ncbi:MAG: cyanophycinase [Phycisphaerales bacterium]|nr:MAG: cyanophycinase [Phycisphaerales bacterium]